MIETIRWREGTLLIIDQTLLPHRLHYISLDSAKSVWDAIKELKVRGAPAIGVCAAYGVLVALREKRPTAREGVLQAVNDTVAYLKTSRPTAVNLFWALDRMARAAESLPSDADFDSCFAILEQEAGDICREDKELGKSIGRHGACLLRDGDGVLTHCNAGGLATAGYGTALAVMFRAHEEGRDFQVFVDETRPLLQGARLTTWELMQADIDVTLICDNMAAWLMSQGKVQVVIVGADRIAANGDTANKIGTYGLALLAQAHSIPFYIAAPSSTFDFELSGGHRIPIEMRESREVTNGFDSRTAPDGVQVLNPAFDVTPARLITGIVTEHGIIRAPDRENIETVLKAEAY
ncbi:MAG: S-methyl-5-thioribose-1-phosphate isomerase [Candidatus Hydrogenedentes bacterium]|nr:S-methyl-5-thioribose-1-phosphate isomerase [Candidatus Hydrogenedentota bacterium]